MPSVAAIAPPSAPEGDVEIASGNVHLAMSHVVPDLVQKVLKGQNPLHILGDGSQIRHYTYGGDLAEGIVLTLDHPAALNEDFNISTATSTTVLELAELIWKKVHGEDIPFAYVTEDPDKQKALSVSESRTVKVDIVNIGNDENGPVNSVRCENSAFFL